MILVGDCLELLPTLDAKSVHTCVTSPPYFGLRKYGDGTEIGHEPTPDEFVQALVAVFREVRRVLRDDGTLWLNLGDSYAGSGKGGNPIGSPHKKQGSNAGSISVKGMTTHASGAFKPKDLIGIPWRVAFALQADGWYLRQDIIWHKPNPMPESVRDRCTKSHEYVFLLSKGPRYYFDAEAIKEPVTKDYGKSKDFGGFVKKDRLKRKKCADMAHLVSDKDSHWTPDKGRNRRSVWTVTTQPFKGAHFATYPPKLIEPCILAGTSERGVCPQCGAPWVRVIDRKPMVIARSARTHDLGRTRSSGTMVSPPQSVTTGFAPTCRCDAGDPVPATVLDPFAGAGTTWLVANRLGRKFIGCELYSENAEMSAERVANDAPKPVKKPRKAIEQQEPADNDNQLEMFA